MKASVFPTLGMFLSAFMICTTSAGAQVAADATHVAPPTSCTAHPAGLDAGSYPWDSPACSADRMKWNATHASSAANAPSANTIDGRGTLVPAGTAVPVRVVGTISSGSVKPDDVFQFQAAQDVILDDMIVIRKGAGGQGHIVDVNSAGGNGHSGAISLAFDYVYAVDGGRLRLSDAAQTQSEDDRKGASSTATIIGFATFGIGGLFGHNFAHGRQKTLDEHTIIESFIANTVHVVTTEHAVSAVYDR